VKRKRIGQTFVQLRRLLKLTPTELIERSDGTLVRGELHKVETGQSLVSTVPKREALARAYAVDIAVITALVDGTMTPEEAAALAKTDGASVRSPVGPPSLADQGEAMAIFVRLEHARKSRFPGLEVCLLYHEMSGGKTWRDATIKAARSGDFSAVDLPPDKWRELLDRLEEILRTYRQPEFLAATAGEPTPTKE